MHLRIRWTLAAAITFLAIAAPAPAGDVPLKLQRLELADGRTLTNVVIKSYDAATGRLLLVADGTAMLIPVKLVPAPFGERLKADAPRAGSSMSVVATAPDAGPKPAPAEVAAAAAPVPDPGDQALVASHRAVAEERARQYYEFEFLAGSGAVSVTKLDVQTQPPEPIPGWAGRYRTRGRAFVEFFESKGRSFGRRAGRFEVVTEQKPDQSVVVVEFRPGLPAQPTVIGD